MARRARPFRILVAVAALAYVLVVAVVPALHHDFQCHVQHPGHCDSCRAIVAAPGAAPTAHVPVPTPEKSTAFAPMAGRACSAPGMRCESGRAPPHTS